MLATKSTTAKQTRSGGFVESHALPSAEMIESYFLGDGNTFWVDDDNIPAPSFGLPPPPTSAYVINQPSFDGAAFDLFDIAEDVVAVLERPQGTTDYHRNAQPEVWSPQRGQGPRVVWKADSHGNSDVGGGGRQQSTFYAEEATIDTELITFGSFISDADGEKDNVPSVPQLIFEHAALPPQGETSLHWALGDDFELESAASIDAGNFGQSVGRVRLRQPHRALSPPELSDASDDMDDWLLRHLPTHGIGLSFRDMLSSSGRDNSKMQASSSLPLPFSAEELQQLLTGTMDLHALFGDDDDLVFSPPQQSAEHNETQLLMTVPGPKAGHRRSTTLNAVPQSEIPSLSNDCRDRLPPHFCRDRDVIERRLQKALCALQATYLLTPRLFASVFADHHKQTRRFDSRLEQPSLPSDLSKRLERHLSGIMELEAHAMRLLVHFEIISK